MQPAQAASDDQLIALWLHGKARTTQDAYRYEAGRFIKSVNMPLSQVKLGDLQAYLETIAHLAPASQARATNTIKSLFSFAHRIGYVQWNVAAPIKAPKVKNTLAERILTEDQVRQMLTLEPHPQHRVMLRLLYAGALRISELCELRWRDLQPRNGTGQITVFGKGGKTGVVLLPSIVWQELQTLEGDRIPDSFVFPSTTRQQLHRSQAWRIVKRAAHRAGLEASCHWLRHCHASHALDRGASIALVQQTLRHSSVATTSKYLHVHPNESSGGFLAL
ncbi:MAG TPA: tyrosine-type recombinase/integrase [Trichocoleus sp.]|jgi:integrase/recombinase XerD